PPPPPPRSTLFPYTTLFRSHCAPSPRRAAFPRARPPARDRDRFPARRSSSRPWRGARRRAHPSRLHPFLGRSLVELEGAEQHAQDRKSTRLNSSHVSISYAV